MSPFNIDDYVDVATRITEFYAKWPEGSICTETVEYQSDPPGWKATAYAVKTPDDQHPKRGTAFEPVPGKTQFTRDSECQNAETAAWGRAIVACGIGAKKIASREEVSTRLDTPQPAPQEASSGTASASAADDLTTAEKGIQDVREPTVSMRDLAMLRARIGELRQLDAEHPRVKQWDKLGAAKQKALTPSQAAGARAKTQDAINQIKLANPELPVTA